MNHEYIQAALIASLVAGTSLLYTIAVQEAHSSEPPPITCEVTDEG